MDRVNRNTIILQQALDINNSAVNIVPYYQPICDAEAKVIKYEALARIEKEANGEILVIFP